jgi:hypothetical protein
LTRYLRISLTPVEIPDKLSLPKIWFYRSW